jgi:hypothetical protein
MSMRPPLPLPRPARGTPKGARSLHIFAVGPRIWVRPEDLRHTVTIEGLDQRNTGVHRPPHRALNSPTSRSQKSRIMRPGTVLKFGFIRR